MRKIRLACLRLRVFQQTANPFALSGILHIGILGFFFAVFATSNPTSKELVDMTVYEHPRQAPTSTIQPISLKPVPNPAPKQEEQKRAVFGISKNTLTEETQAVIEDESGVEIKAGNTVAVAPDDLKLKPSDADSIPIPTEEYLVTQMPVILEEVRIPYPEEAKKQGIEGPVIMDLLVDEKGLVRDATLIEGPAPILNLGALDAVKRMRFQPARIREKWVAVKIRYIYRFVLEP